MNSGIQELWEDVGNKSCATLLWSPFFFSWALVCICLPFFYCAGAIWSAQLIRGFSWPHTVQPKQASSFRMQMSGQKQAWSILCSQLISFSLPLSRNRSDIKKWILLYMWRHPLMLLRISPWNSKSSLIHLLEYLCATLCSHPEWGDNTTSTGPSLSNADKSKRNISNRY